MYIFGKNPIIELFNNRKSSIIEIYINKKRYEDFCRKIVGAKIKLYPLEEFKDQKLLNKEKHQDIVAKVVDPKILPLNKLIDISLNNKNKTLILLDRINDPHNFGAIIRSSVAFDASGIVFTKNESAPLNGSTVKASAGTWFNMNFSQESNLTNVVRILKERGYWIVSTTLDGDKTLEDIKNFEAPLAIILGNEGSGIKRSLIQKSDLFLKIDISEKVNSLNVSATAGIILNSLYKK